MSGALEFRNIMIVAAPRGQHGQHEAFSAESITPQLIELERLEKSNGDLSHINGGSTNQFVGLQQMDAAGKRMDINATK
jgi:hypothetical protein